MIWPSSHLASGCDLCQGLQPSRSSFLISIALQFYLSSHELGVQCGHAALRPWPQLIGFTSTTASISLVGKEVAWVESQQVPQITEPPGCSLHSLPTMRNAP